jgi:hypothetical protein
MSWPRVKPKRMTSSEEVDIPGFEGLYRITKSGIITSYSHIDFIVRKNGTVYPRRRKGVVRSIYKGYYMGVILFRNTEKCFRPIHRLLALAFIPNPENKPQVNHIDGNRYNNSLDNLEWVTAQENTNHAYETGLESSGEKRYNAKLTVDQVREIRCLYDLRKHNTYQLAVMYGVCQKNIHNIVTFKVWKRV